jgi:hypothetical protein
MEKITNRQILAISDGCERCNKQTRVMYTITDESGEREYLCEDCVSKDDAIE